MGPATQPSATRSSPVQYFLCHSGATARARSNPKLADRLERGQDSGVVTFHGRLFWEWAVSARPEWGSADDRLPAPDERLPELDLSCGPADLVHAHRAGPPPDGADSVRAVLAGRGAGQDGGSAQW